MTNVILSLGDYIHAWMHNKMFRRKHVIKNTLLVTATI